MLETAFHEPLMAADPPVVYPTRLVEFSNQVFANLDELRSHSARLIAAFQVRQREQSPVVDAIGDILLDAALEWGQAYIDYTDAQVLGEHLVNEEKTQNSAFSTFLAVSSPPRSIGLGVLISGICTVPKGSIWHQAGLSALSPAADDPSPTLPVTTGRICKEDSRRSSGPGERPGGNADHSGTVRSMRYSSS
jgi:hypothetical protein